MSRFRLIASTVSALCLAGSWATAQDGPDSRSFSYDCLELLGSLLDGSYTCSGARISDGQFELTADTAETNKRDFEQSEWRLHGNVSVAFDSALLTADSASFRFVDDELIYFELRGSPAMLSDFIEERGVTLTAGSNVINYEQEPESLRLTGEVRVEVDGDEIVTDRLVYNLSDNSFGTGDVSVRLSPESPGAQTQPDQRADP